ncbi:dehydrogenase [Lacticaseibacillus thailandensis DSM 22698 = JCM 13996]|uniref:Dehydrogenase n=3 Tax=Lacticaseibacillus thailandensis TaxID=381741 RepID=A0A0R2C7E4_9LACO|nr:dehydrogenase [Lacticaseibacillus thailandensis DSM 22698 = JCM 13996]
MVPVTVARPTLKPGYVLIKIKAFGINPSEVISRRGQSDPDFSYPRILGIEGVGVVAAANSGSMFKVGQQVAALMGGLGREIDGTYAEYTLARENGVIPFTSALDWDVLGALPETLQTAYGSLRRGLHLHTGDVLLVHGGTSTVGLMATALAKQAGATVIATTRNRQKLAAITKDGADHAVLDDAQLAATVRQLAPDGVDKVLELVGADKLIDDMQLLKEGGRACLTGSLDGCWTLPNFSPFAIPTGTFLTSYGGAASDLPVEVLAAVLSKVEAGQIPVQIAKVYHGLAEAGQAQADLESSQDVGKHVVVL